MDNFENNGQAIQTEAPSDQSGQAQQPKAASKLLPVYILIGVLLIAEIAGFMILKKEAKKQFDTLSSVMTEGLGEVRTDLSAQVAEVKESIKTNGSEIKAVSENLGTLQEDHEELERTITEKVNAVSVSQKCANAVFYIEMYDEDGWMLGSGSGFFIDPSGIAVTNFHVIDGCTSATAMLTNGEVYDIIGVYDYDIAQDIALIQVDGEGFDTLTVGDGESVVAGAEVYAIGSPSGLDNTISTGIISNVSRYVDGMDYIQFTAPISCGSSGGALLDEHCNVIGITSAYWIGTGDNGTQNLNLAIPIAHIDELECEETETLSDVYASTNVFSDAYILASESYFILPTDGSRMITVFESTGDPNVTFRYEIDDESVVSAEWGEWIDSNTSELNISAAGEGSTCIWLYLVGEDDSIICTDYVWVDVTDDIEDVELTADKDSLTLKAGQTVTVNFHESSVMGGDYLWYSVTNGNIECEWGEWDGDNNIDLYVTGVSSGADAITVSAFDSNDNFLKSIEIPVLVE